MGRLKSDAGTRAKQPDCVKACCCAACDIQHKSADRAENSRSKVALEHSDSDCQRNYRQRTPAPYHGVAQKNEHYQQCRRIQRPPQYNAQSRLSGARFYPRSFLHNLTRLSQRECPCRQNPSPQKRSSRRRYRQRALSARVLKDRSGRRTPRSPFPQEYHRGTSHFFPK